jgi:ABC-type nitrate/sulfonate/bicarbonate transport system permease component
MATVRASAPSAPLSALLRRFGNRFTGLLSLLAFIVLWQVFVLVSNVEPILVPAPRSVAAEFIEVWQGGILWPPVLESLYALAIGLGLAIVVGVVTGLMIGASRWGDMLTSPYLYGLFATPRIALLPLFVLWMGFGLSIKITLVFLGAVLPIILSCKEGVQTVDESLIRAARSFCAGRGDLFKQVVVPFTLPFIANGIRNGIARGFVGLLIVEMSLGAGGIGAEVIRSMGQFRTARMFTYVIVLVAISLALITLSRRFEARISRWREQVYV